MNLKADKDRPRGPFDPACPFCPGRVEDSVVGEFRSAIAVKDINPVTPGHVLILPRKHKTSYFEMSRRERRDADKLLLIMKDLIQNADRSVKGFNIGMNCGLAAGQSIMHAHIHLIPRRAQDTPRPRGGVRGVIPEKMDY